ncbi:hypothetical protein ACXOMR_004478 [Vibrio parahaemolyticus]
MSLIKQLIEEINSKPIYEDCKTCRGQGEIQSYQWQDFFKKYGSDAMEHDSRFDKAETAVNQEFKWDVSQESESKLVTFLTSNQYLTEEEANDLIGLYMRSPDVECCPDCEGDKRVLSEHGELVIQLRSSIL